MEEQMLLVNMHLYPKAYVYMYVCLIINWLSIGLCQLTKTDQLSSIEQLIFLIIISSTVHDLIILLFVYIKPSHHQGLEPLYLSYFTLSSINWMKWNFKKILYVHVLWQTTCLMPINKNWSIVINWTIDFSDYHFINCSRPDNIVVCLYQTLSPPRSWASLPQLFHFVLNKLNEMKFQKNIICACLVTNHLSCWFDL